MLCLRCLRRTAGVLGPSSSRNMRAPEASKFIQQSRTHKRAFNAFTHGPARPSIQPLAIRANLAPDTPASSLVAASSSVNPGPFVQIRGAKRDTFNPSHFVRKRRHGFLSRLRSRTGRKILKRRRMKGRTTLSH